MERPSIVPIDLPGLFVTGTDTAVGKTRIAAAIAACLIASGRKVGVLKPIATGAMHQGKDWTSEDASILNDAIGGRVDRERITPLLFEEPLAPVVAARRQGQRLDQSKILLAVKRALTWWADRADVVVVEGVGGLLCPLAEGTTVADLAIALDYPLVIVARRGLGTLNHTLLTVEAARRRGLRIAGVVLNGSEPTMDPIAEATNPGELSRRLDDVALLANIPHVGDPSALSIALQGVDWSGRAFSPRMVDAVGEPERS